MASDDSASPGRGARRWRRRCAVAVGLVGLGALAFWLWVVAVPFPEALLEASSVESRRILDRHGRLLREALNDQQGRGRWVSLSDEVSPWVPRAFIAVEDHRFESHPGVDPFGILRAARDNLRAGRVVAGGSTLTQQLVGQLVPTPRTLLGKLHEAVLALRLERAHDKHFILEQYVNRVPFGHGTMGIEAASRLYFDKPAVALSLAESALLAGIPRAPSRSNPWTDADRARARQHEVLSRMHILGVIDDAAWAQALAEPLRWAEPARAFSAPHFTAFVRATDDTPGERVTTLDLRVQRQVEAAVDEVLASLADKRVGQAAVLVLDTRSGEVLAWVGSRDFFGADDGQVDMILGRRQPGSTLKPFVYALGLEDGLTGASLMPDAPLFFETLTGDYRPRNYDRRFRGWVRLREALACSYNVPAVWLAHRVGLGRVFERLKAVGFDSLDQGPAHYGLGLALGNGEVRLLELTNAYRVLANGGVASPVRWQRDETPVSGERVLPKAVAQLLVDMLSDPNARAPAFGRPNALELPFDAFAKTGTSADFTDNWTVGASTAVTVGVWVGNFDGRPMEGVSGITGAGRLWHRVMRDLHPGPEPAQFARDALAEREVCAETEPGDTRCTHRWVERFVPGTGPQPAPPARRKTGLRVVYPDADDVFSLMPDVPSEHARLHLRAELEGRPLGPEHALRWEVDGTALPYAPGVSTSWVATPGRHRVRAWLEDPSDGRPAQTSDVVRFEVLPTAE
jgi:penicillin-binding protein 1C